MMKMTVSDAVHSEILGRLTGCNNNHSRFFPGERPGRQPIHTVYEGAQFFQDSSIEDMGREAQTFFLTYAEDFSVLARALQLPGFQKIPRGSEFRSLSARLEEQPEVVRDSFPQAWLAWRVHRQVLEKLKTEAVEDYRIDFEDGFGYRSDSEEDEAVVRTAGAMAAAIRQGRCSPFTGIRIKTFNEEWKYRAARTCDLFITTLLNELGRLPQQFVVTLPKVIDPDQVRALAQLFDVFEQQRGLPKGTLKLELMVETTQSIFSRDGRVALPEMVAAADGRCTGAHFGTYDYTTSCDITAGFQAMDHPVCDFARHVMKVALAGTGIWLSDGATNIMPIGPHQGDSLTHAQIAENTAVVHRAWKTAFDHTTHSLRNGFYQGWDLHAAQLPVRYAACHAFFLQGLASASQRLGSFVEKATQSTVSGEVFDDAATGQALLNYFLRALNCGAIGQADLAATGLSLAEVQTRSFLKILEGRQS